MNLRIYENFWKKIVQNAENKTTRAQFLFGNQFFLRFFLHLFILKIISRLLTCHFLNLFHFCFLIFIFKSFIFYSFIWFTKKEKQKRKIDFKNYYCKITHSVFLFYLIKMMRLQAPADWIGVVYMLVWIWWLVWGEKGSVICGFFVFLDLSRVLRRSMIAVFSIFPNSLWRCHGATSIDFELHTSPATGSKTAFHPIPVDGKWKFWLSESIGFVRCANFTCTARR